MQFLEAERRVREEVLSSSEVEMVAGTKGHPPEAAITGSRSGSFGSLVLALVRSVELNSIVTLVATGSRLSSHFFRRQGLVGSVLKGTNASLGEETTAGACGCLPEVAIQRSEGSTSL